MGTRPWEEEEKWKDCRLAQVLVNEEALSGTDLVKTKLTIGEVDVPKQLGYGVDRAEKMMLLDSLPVVTAHMATADKIKALQQQGKVDPDEYRKDVYKKDIAKQLHQTNMFAKVLDLQNANAAGIAYVNRQRIIKAFSTSKNPFDTGRTEVQGTQLDQVHRICPLLNLFTVALLTYKIRHLWKHLTTFKRDVGNRRNLRLLVHKRARMLRYLKRESRDRYETLLPMLALEPESVEGELVI